MPSKVYGAPLPPGLEAPTCGELCIRIDKLILDDIAMNRNPLIHFPLGPSGSARPSLSGSPVRDGAPPVSPNRFVVPVDHCAVSPFFWGEPRPSASCLPATPGQPARGAVPMVYPIKVSEDSFLDYLRGMSQSPHHGVQLEVYVPSTYSGRPAVPVGKSIVQLDQLSVGRGISGWFTVAHAQAQTDKKDGSKEGEGAADEGALVYFTVGKMKLSIQLNFFARPTPRPSRATALQIATTADRSRGSSRSANVSRDLPRTPPTNVHAAAGLHNSSIGSRGGGAGEAHEGLRRAEGAGVNRSITSEAPSSPHVAGDEHGERVDVGRPPRTARTRHARASTAAEAAGGDKASSRVDTAGDLLSPAGLQREVKRQTASTALTGALESGLALRQRILAAMAEGPAEVGVPLMSTDALGQAAGEAESDDTVYSSQESDEEQFALHLQQEQARRQAGPPPAATAAAAGALVATTRPAVIPVVSRRDPTVPSCESAAVPPRGSTGPPVKVELTFTGFSFAATPMTADLTEMRLSVRLSRDVTTDEPTAGPFSSYVHQVPLGQPTICLSFHVRSFSAASSRLVVELLKVRSTATTDAAAAAGGGPAAAHAAPVRRLVLSEESLGLCIVGLHAQTRELALRDALTDLNNAYCHLTVTLSGGSAGAAAEEVNLSALSGDRGSSPGGARGAGRARRKPSTPTRRSSRSSGASSSLSSRGSSASASSPSSSSSSAGHCRARRHRSGGSRKRHSPRAVSHRSSSESSTTSPAEGNGRGHPRRSGRAHRRGERQTRPHLLPTAAPAQPRTLRLHVAIQAAVQLPKVSIAAPDGGAARVRGLWTMEDGVDTPDTTVAGGCSESGESFRLPNSFFLVDALLPGRPPRDGGEVGEIENWAVASYAHGFHDRTAVVPGSASPVYHYKCVLEVPVPPTAGVSGGRSVGVKDADPAVRAELFREHVSALRLGLWHHEGTAEAPTAEAAVAKPSRAAVAAAKAAAPNAGSEEVEAEIQFWALSAQLGECVVDLRPLEFLSRLDGFYRVTSQLPVFVEEEGPAATSGGLQSTRLSTVAASGNAQTIGYVHVSVWTA